MLYYCVFLLQIEPQGTQQLTGSQILMICLGIFTLGFCFSVYLYEMGNPLYFDNYKNSIRIPQTAAYMPFN